MTITHFSTDPQTHHTYTHSPESSYIKDSEDVTPQLSVYYLHNFAFALTLYIFIQVRRTLYGDDLLLHMEYYTLSGTAMAAYTGGTNSAPKHRRNL